MLDLALSAALAACASGGAIWLWLKPQRDAAYLQGRAEVELELAQLQGQWQHAREQWQLLEQRETDTRQALDHARQQYAENQQKLASLASHLQRVPDLEQRLREKEQQLSVLQQQLAGQGARLAASEEQGRQLERILHERGQLQAQLAALQQEHTQLQISHQQLQTLLEQERQQAADKLTLLGEARESLSQQFKILAADILEEKSQRFTEQNRQHLGQLLGPMQERLQTFGKLVQDTYDKDSKERLSLENELRRLQQLNTQLNQDAVALTKALTGSNNKAQGNWGEMVLEKVLESSGLLRDREYRVQVSGHVEQHDGSQRRYQPDVVIDLPENKQLVIDAKVSLNAYVRYTASSDATQQEAELKAHIASLRHHIRTLADKRYQDLYKLNTLDFVFMFIPVEPAYLLAVQHDMSLFSEAFERRIMIVGPSTLLATLRTVASIWRYEYQNRNAQEIARQGGAMYDKLASLAESLDKMGRQIGQLQDSHQQTLRQLSSGSGNLMSRAERLRKLGAKTGKVLPAHLLDDPAGNLPGDEQ